MLPVEVTAKRSYGVEIHEIVAVAGDGSLVIATGESVVVLGDFGDPGFDLDTPTSLRFYPTTPPDGALGVYRVEATPEVHLGQENPDSPEPLLTAVSAELSLGADGTVLLECPAFRPSLPANADDYIWPYLYLDVFFHQTMPYAATTQLDSDVAGDPRCRTLRSSRSAICSTPFTR